ncbi:serine/arginine-rich splicing factor SC35 isoform X1 [Selaginella moellendorffii]|nr:serine/arginine-rich splicing factor SC35 isoform X1 [Selaginella moellendorffii]|eukprot:XP_002966282.2 serine/arginine-rich splicing factor SC35 isoform X1 [Selaginella moellendorffii]
MSHFGRSGPPDIRDTYSLLVLNITFRTSADDLFPLFDRYGKVVDIFIPRDRRTGDSRGFAFVRYKHADEAQKAIERLDGKNVDGRNIVVQFAKYGRNDESIHRGKITSSSPIWRSRSRSRSPRRGRRDYDDYRERDRDRRRSRSRERYERERYRGRDSRDYRRRSFSRSRSRSRSRGRGHDYPRDNRDGGRDGRDARDGRDGREGRRRSRSKSPERQASPVIERSPSPQPRRSASPAPRSPSPVRNLGRRSVSPRASPSPDAKSPVNGRHSSPNSEPEES